MTVASFKASAASASHGAATAGTAARHDNVPIAQVMTNLFMAPPADRSIQRGIQKGQPRRAALFCLATLATGAVYEVFFSWATSASSICDVFGVAGLERLGVFLFGDLGLAPVAVEREALAARVNGVVRLITPAGLQPIGAQIGDQHFRVFDRRAVQVDVHVPIILALELRIHPLRDDVAGLDDEKLAAREIQRADVLIALDLGRDGVKLQGVEHLDELDCQLRGTRFLLRDSERGRGEQHERGRRHSTDRHEHGESWAPPIAEMRLVPPDPAVWPVNPVRTRAVRTG